MPTKLRLRVSGAELDYEGDGSFTKEDIKALLDHLAALNAPPSPSSRLTTSAHTAEPTAAASAAPALHLNSVAAKLEVKSGPDLAIAAAAHLQVIEGLSSFSHQMLLDKMREAPKYYKASHGNNLKRTISNFVGTRLNQIATDKYSLTAAEAQALELKLA